MKLANRVFLLTLAIVAGLTLAGCGKQQCATTQLGSSGTGSGTTGGINTGGSICGPGTTNPGGSSISVLLYYFALDNTGAGTVAAAGLSNTGTLSLLNPYTPPTLPTTGTENMVIVNKQFLYVPMGDGTVQAFTISRATGALTPINGGPFFATGADSAVSDPKGRFLFVGAEFLPQITVFTIDPITGFLTNTGVFSGANMLADSLAVDGNGLFLYVGQGVVNPPLPVAAFSIDQHTGALSEIQGSPFNLGVATVHADPSGKFLLGVAGILDMANLAIDNHLFVFSIDPTSGKPTALSNVQTTAAPFEFAIHPSGQFIYTFAADSTAPTAAIEGYKLDSAGTLTALPNSPFTSLPIVQDCQFDQSGGEAFCVDSISLGTTFSVFSVNPTTGMLTNAAQNLTVTNTFPFAVTD